MEKYKLNKKIVLNEKEKLLFDDIKSLITSKNLGITPRVAGGWVRDKLLNLDNYDIDITLDTVSGYEFAILFKENSHEKTSSIGLIKMNPEKSKHLETATMFVNGMSIDFLQLRTEKYLDSSRIPTVVVGNPTEDSFRRDITINTLFYNIMTDEIEDFTKMGLNDLKLGIIRTPLDPLKTFIDDPLRILRVFRFSCAYGFEITKEIFAALENKEIKHCLKDKVSNERIGIEIKKIISTKNACKVFRHFIVYDLFESVFKYKKPENYTPEQFDLYTENFHKIDEKEIDLEIFRIYSILICFCGMLDSTERKKTYLNYTITKIHLKFDNVFTRRIDKIEKNIEYLMERNIYDEKLEILRIVRFLGDEWINSIYIYILMCKTYKEASRARELEKLINLIKEYGFQYAHQTKPIINGNILKVLNIKNTMFSKIIEESVEIQILNNLTNPEEVLDEIKKRYTRF
ncbi:hypothetical protein EDEG_01611 [Edhazardia aedis USNM 41457]|uniref:Poly A polymerase head domain-containing protein n=1 Tax=Edhazardia aedis (strain USNM 41457) TaxID=1003232 RepID=J9D9D1_EDHAE|nr:hypothetical protein EDEG_01611 [Edhazardia aedis USNM 41457]|eukprot:EJW04089.1 hypothetical protein EDEG_01611 [Edhazardia aedis USNM 41457]